MAYKNIPFYLTSSNYGIFIPTPSLVSYEIQSKHTTRVNITAPGESISMMLIYGSTPKEIIHTYGVITGMPALVPAWTMGLWLTTSPPTNHDKDTVDHLLDGMKGRSVVRPAARGSWTAIDRLGTGKSPCRFSTSIASG